MIRFRDRQESRRNPAFQESLLHKQENGTQPSQRAWMTERNGIEREHTAAGMYRHYWVPYDTLHVIIIPGGAQMCEKQIGTPPR